MSSVLAEPMITLETAAAGEICPGCDSLKQNVEFKTYYHEGGDTIVCEDCFNEMEGSEEEEEDEDEEEEEEEEEDDDCSSVHSTCCAECGESFKFDVPVPAADYHNNDHDQVCPPCMAKTEEPEAKEPEGEEEPEDEVSSVHSCLKLHCPGTTTQNWCDDCMKDGDKSQNASYPLKHNCDWGKEEKEEEEQEEEQEEDEEEEGQDCRGCGCWLPDGKECVFPGSWLAFCEPCYEERQEEEEEESE